MVGSVKPQKGDDPVLLGEEMKVVFSIGENLPIYVKSCKAKKSSTTDNSVDFFLIESGCEKPKTGLIAQIDPQQQGGSCDSGKCKVELLFNQFGFVSDGASSGNLFSESLVFRKTQI